MQKVVTKLPCQGKLVTFLLIVLFCVFSPKVSLASQAMDSCDTVSESADQTSFLISEVQVETIEETEGNFREMFLVAESTGTEQNKAEQKNLHRNCQARKAKNGDMASNGTPCNRGNSCIFPGKQCGRFGSGHCVVIQKSGDGECDCKCLQQ